MPAPLPDIQSRVFAFLKDHADEAGLVTASMAEIARGSGTGGGISSTLETLDRKGYLRCVDRGADHRKATYRVFPNGQAVGESVPYRTRVTCRIWGHPEYVYRPWSERRRKEMSHLHKRRMGIPEDFRRLYGVFVPEEFHSPLWHWASWVRQNMGVEAATAYVRKAKAEGWTYARPCAEKIRKNDPRYVFRGRAVSSLNQGRRLKAMAAQLAPYAPEPTPQIEADGIDLELIHALAEEHMSPAEIGAYVGINETRVQRVLRTERLARLVRGA